RIRRDQRGGSGIVHLGLHAQGGQDGLSTDERGLKYPVTEHHGDAAADIGGGGVRELSRAVLAEDQAQDIAARQALDAGDVAAFQHGRVLDAQRLLLAMMDEGVGGALRRARHHEAEAQRGDRRAAERNRQARRCKPDHQCPSNATREVTSLPSARILAAPPSSGRSMTNRQPTTCAPARSRSLIAAKQVPPVAIRSSTTTTWSPFFTASTWISIRSLPYSRS